MIESVVNETKEKKEIEYPCLMQNKEHGYVVAFESYGIGIVLTQGTNDHHVFKRSNRFVMECFTPFNGSITLSNEVE